MSFNPLTAVKVAKLVVAGVVGIGTGKIVGGIIKTHVQPTTLVDKVTVTAAAWVISGIATTATKKYTNDLIDQVTEGVTEQVNKIKEAGKLTRIEQGQSTFEKEGLNEDEFERTAGGSWKRITDVQVIIDKKRRNSTLEDATVTEKDITEEELARKMNP